MSRGKRAKGGRVAPQGREDHRGGLRVIQGGRAGGDERARGGAEARSRRCEPPGRVKRRRRIVAAVLAFMAVGLTVYILLGPVTRVIESRRNLSQVENQLKEEQSRTAALEERKAWDMTETFVEWEARKMGYVKPGEIPIIVIDYREEEPSTESTAETPSP